MVLFGGASWLSMNRGFVCISRIMNSMYSYSGYDMASRANVGPSQKKARWNSQPRQPIVQERAAKAYEIYQTSISSLTHEALNQIMMDIHPMVSEIDNVALANEWDAWIPDLGHTRSRCNEFLQAVMV